MKNFLTKDNAKQVHDTLDKIKKANEKRNKYIMNNQNEFIKNNQQLKDVKKDNWKNKGWTDDRSMKLAAQIPADLYYADKEYWDNLIKNGSFNDFKKKHPDLVVSK